MVAAPPVADYGCFGSWSRFINDQCGRVDNATIGFVALVVLELERVVICVSLE